MKKKCILSITLLLIMTMLFGLSVFAGTDGNGDSTGEGTVDPNASVSGFSKMRTGYMIYITDGAGTPVSPIRFVRYLTKPSHVTNTLATRVTGTRCTDFYNGNISDATNGGFTKPPLDVTTGYGFGAEFKNWLISDNGSGSANIFDMIRNIFDGGHVEGTYASAFRDNDYFLCVEAVMWCGVRSSNNPAMIMGTTKTLNQIFERAGSTYLSNTRMMRLPHAGYITMSWGGCSAASVNSGTKERLEDLTATGNGYGMIMCRSSEASTAPPTEVPEPIEVRSDDYLRANELNYFFPDFIVGDTAGRSKDHYPEEAKINMNDKGNWAHTDEEEGYDGCKLDGGVWSVSETISSDVVNFYGKDNCLLYRDLAGQWKKPSVEKIFNEADGSVYPGYGYMYSRALWGDNLTVCDFKGNGRNHSDFVTNRLKMNLGHDGGTSGISAGTNKEVKVPTVKTATYTFKGQAVEFYKHWEIVGSHTEGTGENAHEVYDWDWVDHTENISQKVPKSEITYSITHGLYKYSPIEKPTSQSLSAGETILRTGNVNRAWTRVAFGSQLGGTVSIYPEVMYTMYYTGTKETWTSVSPIDIYCMGELARTAAPSALHGYKVGYSSGTHMQGKSVVDSALTGTKAFEWVDNFGDNSQDYMQVAAQGSGFSTATTNNPIITTTSFALDLYDGSINGFNPKSTWQSGDPLSSHDSFTSALNANLVTEVTMKRYTDRTNNTQFGDMDNMSYDISETHITPTSTEQVQLKIKDGQIISGKPQVISKIASAYGISTADAESVWSNWGIETQIDNMLESSTDSDNNSGGVKGSPSKWYDEETDCLAITINTSVIQLGRVLFDDKMDYGSSKNQSITDIASVGQTGVQCRFYFSLGFKESTISFDGMAFDVSDKLYLIDNDEILGGRFLVSNATTNNWRK